jgi:hypothetical protein
MLPSCREPETAGRLAGPGGTEPGDFVPDESFFASPGEAFGIDSVGLAIGPLRIRVQGLARPQAAALRERFRPFAGATPALPDLTIGLLRADVPAFLRLPAGLPEEYRLGHRVAGARRLLWSYEFAGWLDYRGQSAALALVAPEGPLFDRGLENFLRVMTASFILEHGGFLLHGSGVVRGGKAYVFFGPSGSGKTTVTDLSPRDTVLSDDLTLVVRGRDGYEAAGIPFGMAHHRVPATAGSFPIASLNRLVQSREVRRHPMSGARALAEVAGSLPFVMQETDQAARAMEVVARALERIPVCRLEFRKDDGFWAAVEGS